MPLQKHKHHDVIVKWAQGYPIQYRPAQDGCWLDCVPSKYNPSPQWHLGMEYRVKPKPVIVKYRVLYRSFGELEISSGYYQTLEDYNKQNRNRTGLQLLESLSSNFEGEYDEPQ